MTTQPRSRDKRASFASFEHDSGTDRGSSWTARLSKRFTSYSFHTTWWVEASAADCYSILNDVERYPTWWREVRGVRQIDDTCAEVQIRASVPYSLRIQLQEEIADERAGLLRTRISGDLDGWSSWSITSHDRGCALRFDEEVVTTKRLMNLLSPIARPLFRLNHVLMMRHGEQGLRRRLS